ncbi:LPO_1073/Vpar_1526 family protein [Neobacillus jeddahensis]|uniref:LPO_1073/Vpar_1526 family protein n=1 Tax=Neobacillus jeddahensis TaxID=1461580 RepID=UPI00058B0AF4|nr:LPO_1073/Vpar_1526 family protein [Neobacillus jeddahensis]
MIGDKQEIIAGDGTTNIQGNKVTVVNNGLSFPEVRQVAMDVFKSNFYDLGEKVEKLVNERAEEILNKYLGTLQSTAPEALSNTEDPDLRFAIYETQKNHARLGDDEIRDLLVDVLIKRTTNQNESFVKLVLNEALTIIPKLTTKQIDVLSFIFMFRYLTFVNPVPFAAFYNTINEIIKSEGIPNNEIFYQHLQYSGCLSISIGSATSQAIMDNRKSQFIDDDVKPLISSYNTFPMYLQKWDNTKLCNSSLTSVGIAIALSNIKRKTGLDLDLRIWVHE